MKAIIIEDEKKSRQLLEVLLNEHCPHVEIAEACEDLPTGVKAIHKHRPDLVFLDIELPGLSGLQLLDFINEDEITFSIIFVTAYNNYAIQAFKLSAIDYLLKPLNPSLLVEAVERYEKINTRRLNQLNILKSNLNSQEEKKIAIPSRDTIHYLKPEDVMYIKGEGAYSTFYLANGEKYMLSRNLKYVEDMIMGITFLKRCHKSYILNKKYISTFSRQSYLSTLLNGEEIPISTERVQDIFPN